MKTLPRLLNDLLGLFYPELCITCGNRLITQEKYVCLKCWADLPENNFHLEPENKVAHLFWGRIHLENATSFFLFRKGSRYQKLIHFIKYEGLKELGFDAGARLGNKLTHSPFYQSVDVIVPVPLHKRKLRKRGYNQSEWIARGLSESMKRPVSVDNLFRKTYTSTQTKKNRIERWENVKDVFGVRQPEKFSGKHILLVDDVVTTGATLESCAAQLLAIENVKVSIATLAYADM